MRSPIGLTATGRPSVGVRCADEAVTLEVYHAENDRIRFLTEDNEARN